MKTPSHRSRPSRRTAEVSSRTQTHVPSARRSRYSSANVPPERAISRQAPRTRSTSPGWARATHGSDSREPGLVGHPHQPLDPGRDPSIVDDAGRWLVVGREGDHRQALEHRADPFLRLAALRDVEITPWYSEPASRETGIASSRTQCQLPPASRIRYSAVNPSVAATACRQASSVGARSSGWIGVGPPIGLGEPDLCGVPEHRLDLRADVTGRSGPGFDLPVPDVGDRGDALDDRAEPCLDLAAERPFPPGLAHPAGRDEGRGAERQERQREDLGRGRLGGQGVERALVHAERDAHDEEDGYDQPGDHEVPDRAVPPARSSISACVHVPTGIGRPGRGLKPFPQKAARSRIAR